MFRIKSNLLSKTVHAKIASTIDVKTVIRFNQPEIARYINKVERGILQGAGARLMNRARKLITTAPLGQASAVGKPFHSHPRRKGGDSGIKRAIQYGYDTSDNSVAIGPTFAQKLFHRHEYGGKAKYQRKQPKVGGTGLIAIGRTYKKGQGKGKKYNYNRYISVKSNSGAMEKIPVVFTRLDTEKQVERAKELEEIIYGEYKTMADYEPRPVLEAALEGADFLEKGLREVYSGG